MDRKTVNELADFIEKSSEMPFNMASCEIPNECGTPGCIAGFAAALWGKEVTEVGDDGLPVWIERGVSNKLGLSYSQAQSLFFMFSDEGDPDNLGLGGVSRRGAVKTLRRLAKTGEVKFLAREQ